MSGMGSRLIDYDNDGDVDLLLCNAHVDTVVQQRIPDVKYNEPMLLFRNDGGRWRNVSAQSGPIFARDIGSRGVAFGDFDNNGSVDLLISINDGPPILLRNNAGLRNHWLGVKLVGRKSNVDAIGAKITWRSGDFQRHTWLAGRGGFLSAHDPRAVLGLGPRDKVDWIEVQWPPPSNRVERLANPTIDRYIKIVEGDGKWT
jgi:hypothetical protein